MVMWAATLPLQGPDLHMHSQFPYMFDVVVHLLLHDWEHSPYAPLTPVTTIQKCLFDVHVLFRLMCLQPCATY